MQERFQLSLIPNTKKSLPPPYPYRGGKRRYRKHILPHIPDDVDIDFKPKYIVSSDKKDIVKQLKKQASSVDTVWLASDEDREGEAIAWHLFESLKLDKAKTKRIVFREITKKAILHAIENPREINYDLVNAQQARRIIDRLVGFEISPIYGEKLKVAFLLEEFSQLPLDY